MSVHDGAPGATRGFAGRLRDAVATDPTLGVPLPGSGRTWDRWQALAGAAAEDLSWGRLVEGHLDAVAILAEAGHPPGAGTYGVFAARGPDSTVTARPAPDGWTLDGRRRYATGVRVLDRALVDVDGPTGRLLVDVDLGAAGIDAVPGTWSALGMAATDSVAVTFAEVAVDDDAVVGGPDFYVRRAGFGHGGCGVAACWWGGATALVADLAPHAAARPDGPRRREVVAAALAARDAAGVLRDAARDLDEHPDDVGRAAARAAAVRWSVAERAREVLARVQAGGGTHPATADPDHARRLADLPVYLTQFGGPVTLDGLDPRVLAPHVPIGPAASS